MASRQPTETRFWAKVGSREPGDCWRWVGAVGSHGYGNFWSETKQYVLAHRWAYEKLVGPIPEGLHIDHLCRNRTCVNPSHLEPVTRAENLRRGISGGKVRGAQLRAKTHCPQGHPYSGKNLYVGREGYRQCKTCLISNKRKWRAGRKAAGLAWT